MLAVNFGSLEIVQFLLQQTDILREIDIKDDTGFTAMTHAIVSKNLEIASMLVEHGASMDIKDNVRQSPTLFISSSLLNFFSLIISLTEWLLCNGLCRARLLKRMTCIHCIILLLFSHRFVVVMISVVISSTSSRELAG